MKGLAYGMPAVRVDGNDVLAVYQVTKEAVARARAGGGPTFIENVSYRIGAHSSSDDPTRYRDPAAPEAWKAKDPLLRFGVFLENEGVLSQDDAEKMREDLAEIREVVSAQEQAAPPDLDSMIQDVTATPNWILKEQLAELKRIRAKKRDR